MCRQEKVVSALKKQTSASDHHALKRGYTFSLRHQAVEPGVSYIREFEAVVALTEVCALSLLTFLLHICASLRLKYTMTADESYSNSCLEIFAYIFSWFPKVFVQYLL